MSEGILGCGASCRGSPSSAPFGGTFPLAGGRLTPQSASLTALLSGEPKSLSLASPERGGGPRSGGGVAFHPTGGRWHGEAVTDEGEYRALSPCARRISFDFIRRGGLWPPAILGAPPNGRPQAAPTRDQGAFRRGGYQPPAVDQVGIVRADTIRPYKISRQRVRIIVFPHSTSR